MNFIFISLTVKPRFKNWEYLGKKIIIGGVSSRIILYLLRNWFWFEYQVALKLQGGPVIKQL